MIIFVIIIFFLLTGLAFGLLLLATKIIWIGKKENTTTESKKQKKLTILIISLIIAGLTTFFFLFTSLAINYKTAYIETAQQGFKVTVKGKRLNMVHDPVSLFLRNTYLDSIQYLIPRNVGIIKGEELPNEPGYYKSVGTITIQNDKMKINLFANDFDDKKLEPDTWNGDYKLVWRNH